MVYELQCICRKVGADKSWKLSKHDFTIASETIKNKRQITMLEMEVPSRACSMFHRKRVFKRELKYKIRMIKYLRSLISNYSHI